MRAAAMGTVTVVAAGLEVAGPVVAVYTDVVKSLAIPVGQDIGRGPRSGSTGCRTNSGLLAAASQAYLQNT